MSQINHTLIPIFRNEMIEKIKHEQKIRKQMEAMIEGTKLAEILRGIPLPTHIQGIQSSIRCSKLREKFYRYSHNFNIEKAEKYSQKINDFNLQEMEDYSGKTDNCRMFNLDTGEFNTGEQSYIDLCDIGKFEFEQRNKAITLIKRFTT